MHGRRVGTDIPTYDIDTSKMVWWRFDVQSATTGWRNGPVFFATLEDAQGIGECIVLALKTLVNVMETKEGQPIKTGNDIVAVRVMREDAGTWVRQEIKSFT